VTLSSTDGSSAFLVRDSASNVLTRVQSDGKVGIGVLSPAYRLDVLGDINLTGALRTNGVAWTPLTSFTELDPLFGVSVAHGIVAGDLAAWNAKVGPTRSISTTAPLSGGGTLAGDLTLSLPAATASVNGYLASADWATFNSKVGGSGTAGYVPAFTASGTVGNSVLYSTAGNVGLGTATPSDNLSVSKASGSSVSIGTGMAPGSIGSPLYTDLNFRGYLDDIRARIRSWDQSTSSGYGKLSFWTKGISDLTEKMRIDINGNVGIGTTTPNDKLEINGSLGIANRNDIFIRNAPNYNGLRWVLRTDTTDETGGDVGTSFDFLSRHDDGSGWNDVLSLNRNGNVGIGTIAPSLGLLQMTKTSGNDVNLVLEQSGVSTWDIRNSATNGNFGIYNGQLGTVSMAIDKANGNVGIGTTTPAAKLHLAGSDPGVTLLLENTSANTGRNCIYYKNQGVNQGYIGLGSSGNNDMYIGAYGTANSINLYNNDSLSMKISPNGNVGIGTATPNERLSLVQSSTNDIGLGIYNSTPYSAGNVAGGYLNLGKYEAAGYNPMVQLVGYPVKQSDSSDGALAIKTRKNGALTTQVTILNTGNVGIGTTTPAAKLHIAGPDPVTTLLLENTSANNGANVIMYKNQGVNQGYIGLGSSGSNDMYISAYGTTNSINLYNNDVLSMRILPNGNVGIGTTTPSHKLYVNGTSGGTNAWDNVSDKRLKKDVLSFENGLDKVMALRPITFNWNKTVNPELKLDDRNHLGFIAQEVEAVLPQVVSTADDAMKTKSVAYSDIVPVLTKAIQEQQTTIEAQQIQIDELKKMVEILMKKQDPAKVKQLK
jgi:hypothetical protein